MNPRRKRKALFLAAVPPAAVLALSGCLGVPNLKATAALPADVTPERAAAIAEIRAQAAAGDKGHYPNVFQSERTMRLAAREEPLSVADVEAIQVELTLIAEKRAAATDAREIAALEARARELRRLALRAGAEPTLR